MSEADNVEFSVGECIALDSLSSTRDVVHVVRSKGNVKTFCNATAWPYARLYLYRFYCNERVPEHRLCSETMEYD